MHGFYSLFIHSLVDGYLDSFHFLTIMNNAAVNIYLHAFVCTFVFSSLEYIPRSGMSRSYGNSVFNLLRGHQPVEQRSLVGYRPWGHKESDTTEWLSTASFKVIVPCNVPRRNIWELQFFHILPGTCYYIFFVLFILISLKWYFNYDFDLHFPKHLWYWASLLCIYWLNYICPLEKCLHTSFAYWVIGVLYIIWRWVSYQIHVWPANISSNSVGQFFSLS